MERVSGAGPIRIKLLGKWKPGNDGAGWRKRFPGGETRWENCEFIMDRDERDYDWLVVWDDLPSVAGERHTLWEEELACPREHTLLVTTEPSTIKSYGSRFLRQFGWVLTSQEPWAIGNHPGGIYRQTGYVWYYAHNEPRGSYDAIREHVPLDKTGEISAVCSTKRQRHTLHRRRYDFVMGLKERLPGMELFGRGIRFVEDKADALDPFKYHVAIENFHGPHHWTEKLADPFLGACMPVYYGCPNAEDYFPAESFLRIDLADVEASAETIRKAIRDDLYGKHRDAVLESRRRVLEEYGPVANLSRVINERHDPAAPAAPAGAAIASRHLLRRKSWVCAVADFAEKTRASLRHKGQRA
ncbi:MAG: glycosyltransferase [Akkermansiaceae bacterium]|nr:glycosyltransferase [Akkermansiaceae bacterium]NNM28978.1 glycosyltransferase [Akkermansiaceae bacterium]